MIAINAAIERSHQRTARWCDVWDVEISVIEAALE
jgi:hypothetical protein